MDGRSIQFPPMDYNEWTPLGRGDPLKNDPTFDYSPPMLQKVKYWVNPLHRTPDPPILLALDSGKIHSQGDFPSTTATSMMTKPSFKYNLKNNEIKRIYAGDIKNDISDIYIPGSLKYSVKPQRLPPSQFVRFPGTNSLLKQPRPMSMLVLPPPPPPLLEPNSYASSPQMVESTLATELSFENTKSQIATSASTNNYVTVVPKVIPIQTPPPSDRNKNFQMSTNYYQTATSAATEKPYLHILLEKEVSNTFVPSVTIPTTTPALTTDRAVSHYRQPAEALRGPTYLIVQGHSKVKKYGPSRVDKVPGISLQDTNEISRRIRSDTTPTSDVQQPRQFKLEDFLPFDEDTIGEAFKDIIDKQAEGSGFGAALTKAIFSPELLKQHTPQYVKKE